MLATCGLGADASLLIAVGRHHPEKRLRTIIQAVSKAQKERKIGLYIAGDGFLRASVERWALAGQPACHATALAGLPSGLLS